MVILSVDDKGRSKFACLKIILEEEMEATEVIPPTFGRAGDSGAEVTFSRIMQMNSSDEKVWHSEI